MPKRRPASTLRRSPTVKRRASVAATAALMVIDHERLQGAAWAEFHTVQKRLEKTTRDLHRHEEIDVPAYEDVSANRRKSAGKFSFGREASSSMVICAGLNVTSSETTTTTQYDKLAVQVRNTANTVLATLATYSNLNKGTTYVLRTFDLAAYKGQTIRIYLNGTEDSSLATSFLVDDTSVAITQ